MFWFIVVSDDEVVSPGLTVVELGFVVVSVVGAVNSSFKVDRVVCSLILEGAVVSG